MKKLLALVLIITLCLGAIVLAEDAVSVLKCKYPIFYNGRRIKTELPCYSIDGNTYVPLREICGIFGISVDWLSEYQSIHLEDGNISLPEDYTRPKIVTTEEEAIAIAKIAIKSVYGYNYDMGDYTEKGYTYEAKYYEKKAVWKVNGVMPTMVDGHYVVGGIPTVLISDYGEIIDIIHTK